MLSQWLLACLLFNLPTAKSKTKTSWEGCVGVGGGAGRPARLLLLWLGRRCAIITPGISHQQPASHQQQSPVVTSKSFPTTSHIGRRQKHRHQQRPCSHRMSISCASLAPPKRQLTALSAVHAPHAGITHRRCAPYHWQRIALAYTVRTCARIASKAPLDFLCRPGCAALPPERRRSVCSASTGPARSG
jgi:hypothetical protein